MKKSVTATQFQTALLTWFDKYGRKNLPWQQNITPYRVWISEIMLQQTQVKTVISYFDRFIQFFPDIYTLASAPLDEVLHLWSGLGYYSRARNMHRCAQIIIQQHQGKFPDNLELLQSLPGIGRSTAGAILAIAYQYFAAILDGNVKRVLTRVHAIEGLPTNSEVQNKLWKLAEYYSPISRIADYTQAIMDLGATVCTRSRPKCDICPLRKFCLAYQQNAVAEFPQRKQKKILPVRSVQLLILQHDEKILLEKRPPVGIWGGLWSLPEYESEKKIAAWCKQRYGLQIQTTTPWSTFRHTFSHFHLDITPIHAMVKSIHTHCMETPQTLWYNIDKRNKIGLSAVMTRILNLLEIHNDTHDLLHEIETTK